MSIDDDRRSFMQRVARGSVLTLGFGVAGGVPALTPAQARARALAYGNLDAAQVSALELLGETILPGARELGLAHFIDHQLGVAPDDSLLIAKYFQVRPPYVDFYAGGVRAAEALASRHFDRPLAGLDGEQVHALVARLSAPGTQVDGFDAFLFYLCLRSDAVDVVYGTPQGFAQLNIPYMEHILPPEGWDG